MSLGLLALTPTPAVATTNVTIGFAAKVISVEEHDNVLGGAIAMDSVGTGDFTYDADATDFLPSDPSTGSYGYRGAPYGLRVFAGGFEFVTDPIPSPPSELPNFAVGVNDNLSTPPNVSDIFGAQSIVSRPLSNGVLVTRILFVLSDTTHSALNSDHLPVGAPDLADWTTGAVQLVGCISTENDVFHGCEYNDPGYFAITFLVTAVHDGPVVAAAPAAGERGERHGTIRRFGGDERHRHGRRPVGDIGHGAERRCGLHQRILRPAGVAPRLCRRRHGRHHHRAEPDAELRRCGFGSGCIRQPCPRCPTAAGGTRPATAAELVLLRNGAPVGSCPGSTVASPDPCVTARSTLASGAVELVVLTSAASVWTLAAEVEPAMATMAGPSPRTSCTSPTPSSSPCN